MPSEKTPEDCPYGSKGCPHIQTIQRELERYDAKLDTIQKTLYAIVGIIAVEFGVILL